MPRRAPGCGTPLLSAAAGGPEERRARFPARAELSRPLRERPTVRATISGTGKPRSAYAIAGSKRLFHGSLPKRSCILAQPSTAPGTVTAWMPDSRHRRDSLRGQEHRERARGAGPEAFRPVRFPRLPVPVENEQIAARSRSSSVRLRRAPRWRRSRHRRPNRRARESARLPATQGSGWSAAMPCCEITIDRP